MEFFKKLTGNTPEVKRAIEERKAQIQAEGEAMKTKIKEDSERQRAAMESEHATRMTSLDQQIAGQKKQMEDNRNRFSFDQTFRGLERNLQSSLTMALATKDISDYKTAMTEMRNEIEAKVREVKENLTSQSLQDLETWALSKVGNNSRVSERVTKALQDFKGDLQKRSVSLE